MFTMATHRPRNIDSSRAAAILYGDLGTSKAYVIGLAFALAGYASFWLIAAVGVLTILIGINYMVICRYYPNGGGVYASVRHRSKIISLIGAFFLIADFLVTAALSALSAFQYLGVSDPVLYAAICIGLIGILNYFGPRHSGTAASFVTVAAIVVLTILAIFCLPHLKMAWHNIQPLKGSPVHIWQSFVGVIVALSGIEAIANITGIMKLNRGSTLKNPIVTRTSTRAIGGVILEVAIYTSLFAFAAAAIGNFEIKGDMVSAPGYPNVRDSMLRYLAQVFVGDALGQSVGVAFAWTLSVVIAVLLLSAVNTAINGLVALQYLMGSDGELPSYFQKVNSYGVPLVALLIATGVPVLLVLLVKNVAGLATLYAIGFVGAIATNLGATSTDRTLDLKWQERSLMFFSFIIMLAIEITLFIDKPNARLYALAVITIGLILRGLSVERKERLMEAAVGGPGLLLKREKELKPEATISILCPVRRVGNALKTAIEKSSKLGVPLHILFVREQSVISESDLQKTWENDPEALKVREYAKKKGMEDLITFHYAISDSPVDIIAAYAMRFDVGQIIIDFPKRGKWVQLLRGDTLKQLRGLLPEPVRISVIS